MNIKSHITKGQKWLKRAPKWRPQPAGRGLGRVVRGNIFGFLATGIIAQYWVLIAATMHVSDFELGLVAAVRMLPSVLLTIPAGVMVDRVGVWAVRPACHLLRTVASLAVAVLFVTGSLEFDVLVIAAFLVGVATTADLVAEDKSPRTIVTGDEIKVVRAKLRAVQLATERLLALVLCPAALLLWEGLPAALAAIGFAAAYYFAKGVQPLPEFRTEKLSARRAAERASQGELFLRHLPNSRVGAVAMSGRGRQNLTPAQGEALERLLSRRVTDDEVRVLGGALSAVLPDAYATAMGTMLSRVLVAAPTEAEARALADALLSVVGDEFAVVLIEEASEASSKDPVGVAGTDPESSRSALENAIFRAVGEEVSGALSYEAARRLLDEIAKAVRKYVLMAMIRNDNVMLQSFEALNKQKREAGEPGTIEDLEGASERINDRHGSIWEAFKVGFNGWIGNRRIWTVSVAVMALNVGWMAELGVQPAFAERVLGFPAEAVGFFIAISGIGQVLGAQCRGLLEKLGARRLRFGLLGALVLIHFLYSAITTFWMVVAIQLVLGALMSVVSLLGKEASDLAPPAISARVASFHRFLTDGGAAIGFVLAGVVSAALGGIGIGEARFALVISMLVLAVYGFSELTKAVRKRRTGV